MWLARTATAKAAVMAVALWPPPRDAWGAWGRLGALGARRSHRR